MRKHRWRKIPKQYIMEEGSIREHVTRSTKKCIHCGLMKGIIEAARYFPVLVYFNKKKILSSGTLPYGCHEANLKNMFLNKKDFEV